ncbi:MAG: hypothetical protein R3F17_12715 [Planctomycetota bacterium]
MALPFETCGIVSAALGNLLAKLDRFEEADRIFETASQEYPENNLVWRGFGQTLLLDGRDQQANLARARNCFENAVRLNDKDAESLYRLGDALAGPEPNSCPR